MNYSPAMSLRRDGFKTKVILRRVLAVVSACFVFPGCLVSQRCYEDRDCPKARICTAEGHCIFECAIDQDCDAKFGLEYNCVSGHCEFAPTCTTCSFAHAEHSCVHGDCQFVSCQAGYFNRDGAIENGCEFRCEEGTIDANGSPDDGCECTPANGGVEHCNDVDDDCDGKVDEDFSLMTDTSNCGSCNKTCPSPPQAIAVCGGGQCRFNCQPGYFDNDSDSANGCESTACMLAPELCNGRDDDCDCPGDTNGDSVACGPGDEGVDEGFDKTTAAACGPHCITCTFPNALATCISGSCQIAACNNGYWDVDGKSTNGCEYACVATGSERCNSQDDDCDGLIDEGEVCTPVCPTDMVAVGSAYCVDRYEASRPDATAASQGTDTTRAHSRAGVLPWMVNPMTSTHLAVFEAACRAAGKHLCTKDEWFAACTGPRLTTFVYGNKFDREACNCVDTYCDDHCAEQSLTSCTTAENCGYSYYCFHEVVTGSFPACTNDYGTLDINGNVWEVVPSSSDSRGYELRGGAFNCASPSSRVNCSFNAGWTELYAGFRCCRAIE